MKRTFLLLTFALLLFNCSDDDVKKSSAEDYFEIKPENEVTLPVWVLSPDVSQTAVIIVHGGPGVGSIGFFDPEQTLTRELAKTYVTVLYDQRTAGGIIQGKPGTDISINKHVSDLKRVIDEVKKRHTNINKIALLGHSWGVPLAVKFAATNPSLVNGLVFINGTINEEFNTEAQRLLILGLAQEAIEEGQGDVQVAVDPEDSTTPITFSMLKEMMEEGESIPFSQDKWLYLAAIRGQLGGDQVRGKSTEEYFFNADYSFTPRPIDLSVFEANDELSNVYIAENLWNLDVTAEAATITKPVLAYWGVNDGICPLANVEFIKNTIGTSTADFSSIEVTDSFHFPHNDNAQSFVASLNAFLSKL